MIIRVSTMNGWIQSKIEGILLVRGFMVRVHGQSIFDTYYDVDVHLATKEEVEQALANFEPKRGIAAIKEIEEK